MKKILIAIIVLVIGAAAASPFLIGSQIEKSARGQIEMTNQQLASALKSNPQFQEAGVTIESYEKGYLSSTAKALVKVAVNVPGESEPKVFEVPLNADIKHGPYLGEDGFGAAKVVARPDVSGLDLPDAINNDTFVIENLVDFAGQMDQKATIAPIKYESESGTTFDFAGAVMTSDSNLSNRLSFTGKVDVEQLLVSTATEPKQFLLKPFTMDLEGEGDEGVMKGNYAFSTEVIEAESGEEIQVVLQSLTGKGTYEQAKGIDLMIGDTEATFKDLVISSEGNLAEPVKIPELVFVSTMKQPDGTDFDITAKYTATLDPSLNQLLNSPVVVKTADFELALNSVPADAIDKYQRLMQELSAAGDEAEAADRMQGELLSIVQMLMQNAMSMHLEVHATSDEGDLNADIDAGFKPGLNMSDEEFVLLMAIPDPQKILSILVGRGDIDLSKGITDKAGVTPMIQLMAADFVDLDGDTFKSQFQITDGQLLVNGSPLPFFAPQAAPAAPVPQAPATDNAQ